MGNPVCLYTVTLKNAHSGKTSSTEKKFGLKIIRTCRTSFEMQFFESVTKQQNRQDQHLLKLLKVTIKGQNSKKLTTMNM